MSHNLKKNEVNKLSFENHESSRDSQPMRQSKTECSEPNSPSEQTRFTMETLEVCFECYAHTFAVFLLGGQQKYLIGQESSSASCLSEAAKLCEEGYAFVGLATSNDFDNWTTAEIGLPGCPLPRGFVERALEQTITIIRAQSSSSTQ